MSKIQLKELKEIITQKSKIISEIEILSSHDDKINKVATAFVLLGDEGSPRCFELWREDAWDAIGAYSDDQIEVRILEIIKAL